MKTKIFTLIVVLFATFTISAQPFKGIEKFTIVKKENIKDLNAPEDFYGKLIMHDSLGYTIRFDNTPVGYKKFIEAVAYVLQANSMRFDNYEEDNSLIPSFVSGITDIENMHNACYIEMGMIDRLYILKNDWWLYLDANSEAYRLVFTK